MDEQDRLLARAAMATPDVAAAAWAEWRATVPQADATGLLVWAGGYIQRNLARAGLDDDYLAGIARHNFIANNRRLVAALPTLRRLTARWEVTPLKSFAMSAESRSRSLRPLADFDFLVPSRDVYEVDGFLRSEGLRPLLGVDDREFRIRIVPRRGSWNYLDGLADIDLHWRYLEHLDTATSDRVVAAETTAASGEYGPVRALSPELLLVGVAVHHALQAGGRMQGLFDVHDLARRADADGVARLARRLDVRHDVAEVLETIREGLGDAPDADVDRIAAAVRGGRPRQRVWRRPRLGERVAPRHRDDALQRHPLLHRIWVALGMRPGLERVVIRRLGGFVRDPQESDVPAGGASLGAGWHYRFPEQAHRWTNIVDARAVFTDAAAATRLRVELDPQDWPLAPYPSVAVVVDGVAVGGLELGRSSGEFALPPHGDRVEVSLRLTSRLRYRNPGTGTQRLGMLAPVRELSLSA